MPLSARRGHSSVADLQEKLKRQARELEEAREERAATQPGQGSTFAFTLPVIVERQVEAA